MCWSICYGLSQYFFRENLLSGGCPHGQLSRQALPLRQEANLSIAPSSEFDRTFFSRVPESVMAWVGPPFLGQAKT